MSRKSEDIQDVLKQIVGMIDDFCREHLNEEYAMLCRKLAEKLARKRPSPLLNGKPNAWACGIVRTIGMQNFLGDKSQKPHMKISDISREFSVGESTASARTATIKNLFDFSPLNFEWSLPSRADENPLIWMLTVNGFIMDIRHAPREAQEVAFEQGLIPYIPADRAEEDEAVATNARIPFEGYWRITSMEMWGQDFVDAEVEGYVEFEPDGRGSFQFGYVSGGIDYRESDRDGKPGVEWSWDGNDEMDPAAGRGWAVIDGDKMSGVIAIHRGDKSTFEAIRKDRLHSKSKRRRR